MTCKPLSTVVRWTDAESIHPIPVQTGVSKLRHWWCHDSCKNLIYRVFSRSCRSQCGWECNSCADNRVFDRLPSDRILTDETDVNCERSLFLRVECRNDSPNNEVYLQKRPEFHILSLEFDIHSSSRCTTYSPFRSLRVVSGKSRVRLCLDSISKFKTKGQLLASRGCTESNHLQYSIDSAIKRTKRTNKRTISVDYERILWLITYSSSICIIASRIDTRDSSTSQVDHSHHGGIWYFAEWFLSILVIDILHRFLGYVS